MVKKISEQERKLFQNAMKDVIPLNKTEKIVEQPTKIPKVIIKKNEPQVEQENFIITDHDLYPVNAEEALFFSRTNLPVKQLKDLKNGKLTIEAVLDLHGMTVAQAREQVERFLQRAVAKQMRVVSIIHGKGKPGFDSFPILKNKINTWLPQFPQVLAFASAIPKDGGRGAVYVWLIRN
jgi:DNA-nicking Smr family endonuclease